MGETSRGIRFLFDYLSHNAYLAWTQIHPLAERYGRSVEAVPVLFAGLLDAHAQLGPAEVLPKASSCTSPAGTRSIERSSNKWAEVRPAAVRKRPGVAERSA